MNELLNNIFDEDSLSAIRNADSIAPSPEYFRSRQANTESSQREEVEYRDVSAIDLQMTDEEPMQEVVAENETEKEDTQKILQANRELELKFATQKELLSKVVKSQNEMIKEFNSMQERMQEFERKLAENKQTSVQVLSQEMKETGQSSTQESKKEHTCPSDKQQTGAGEGLNPDDFSVENIFYFGK